MSLTAGAVHGPRVAGSDYLHSRSPVCSHHSDQPRYNAKQPRTSNPLLAGGANAGTGSADDHESNQNTQPLQNGHVHVANGHHDHGQKGEGVRVAPKHNSRDQNGDVKLDPDLHYRMHLGM